MRDIVALALVAIAIAAFCTFSAAQAFGLFRRGARAQALFALLFPPLGAWLSYRAGMRIRALGCMVSLGLYGVARCLA